MCSYRMDRALEVGLPLPRIGEWQAISCILSLICAGLPGLVMWLSQNEPNHIEDLAVQEIQGSLPLSHTEASLHDSIFMGAPGNTLTILEVKNGAAAATG